MKKRALHPPFPFFWVPSVSIQKAATPYTSYTCPKKGMEPPGGKTHHDRVTYHKRRPIECPAPPSPNPTPQLCNIAIPFRFIVPGALPKPPPLPLPPPKSNNAYTSSPNENPPTPFSRPPFQALLYIPSPLTPQTTKPPPRILHETRIIKRHVPLLIRHSPPQRLPIPLPVIPCSLPPAPFPLHHHHHHCISLAVLPLPLLFPLSSIVVKTRAAAARSRTPTTAPVRQHTRLERYHTGRVIQGLRGGGEGVRVRVRADRAAVGCGAVVSKLRLSC